MSPRSFASKTHRFVEVLSLLTLTIPLFTQSTAVTLLEGAAAVLVALGLAHRPYRLLSWFAILVAGLTSLVTSPRAVEGPLLCLLGSFLVFDSGWALPIRAWFLPTLAGLVLAAEGLSLVLDPADKGWAALRWLWTDGLLVLLCVTFRADLFTRGAPEKPVLRLGDHHLTDRERQILHLVWGGETPKHIAVDLGLSETTVRKDLSRVYAKLGTPGLKELSQLVHSHRIELGS